MKKGFTLLELLIVIIILGILAAIAMPRYFANIEKAREAEAKATLGRIREVELAYYAANESFTARADNPWASAISVTLGGATINLEQPQSASFTYTVPTVAYAQAARKTGTTNSYCMMIESGLFKTCAAVAACVCP